MPVGAERDHHVGPLLGQDAGDPPRPARRAARGPPRRRRSPATRADPAPAPARARRPRPRRAGWDRASPGSPRIHPECLRRPRPSPSTKTNRIRVAGMQGDPIVVVVRWAKTATKVRDTDASSPSYVADWQRSPMGLFLWQSPELVTEPAPRSMHRARHRRSVTSSAITSHLGPHPLVVTVPDCRRADRARFPSPRGHVRGKPS